MVGEEDLMWGRELKGQKGGEKMMSTHTHGDSEKGSD